MGEVTKINLSTSKFSPLWSVSSCVLTCIHNRVRPQDDNTDEGLAVSKIKLVNSFQKFKFSVV